MTPATTTVNSVTGERTALMDGCDLAERVGSACGLEGASAYRSVDGPSPGGDRTDIIRRARSTARDADAAVLGVAEYARSLRRRFEGLRARAEQDVHASPAVLHELNDELGTSHEELRVADDELRRQNEALTETAQRLEHEKHRYEELFDMAPDGYVVTDGYGIVHEANRAAGTMLGISQGFLIGKPLTSFVARIDSRPFLQTLRTAREGDWEEGRIELRLRPRCDRTPIIAELTGRRARASAGIPTSISWSIRDVSSRKRDETSTRDGEIDECVRVRTAELEGATQRQARLIDDLLDASRVLAGTAPMIFEAVDIGRVAKSVVDALRIENPNMYVSMGKPHSERHVLGDIVRLEQLVRRLVLKIHDAGAPPIEVGVECDGPSVLVILSAPEGGREDDAVSSTVVPDPDLMLPHAIADLHGGTIRAASDMEGRWRQFIVRLPMGVVPHKMHDGDGASVDDLMGIDLEGMRTLVVDLDHEGRELILSVLRERGAEVCAASSVADALLLVEDWRPDILIGDVSLGSDSGFDLIRRVRRLGPEKGGAVPAIALTGYADLEASRRALLAGYQVHVAKPIDPSLLAHAVANIAGLPLHELST